MSETPDTTNEAGTTGPAAVDGTSEGDRENGQREQTAEEVEAHIARTREDLAETVDALSAKLDVKTRAREQVRQTTDRAATGLRTGRDRAAAATASGRDALTDDAGDLRPVVPAAGAAVGVALVALAVLAVRRRRRRRVQVLGRPVA